MSTTAALLEGSVGDDLKAIFHPAKTEMDVAARPSDGLVVFSVMWGMAMMLSAASHMPILNGSRGLIIALDP